MEFLGADTEALRGQAGTTRQCGRTLLERTSTLSSTILSVQWTGPDAEELRRRWSAVERRLRDAAESLGERARELDEHAEEQDRASSAEGSGRPPAVLTGVLAGVLPAVGALVGAGLGRVPGEGVGARPWSAAASSALIGAQPADLGPEGGAIPAVPEDHAYASPHGDQTHSAGENNAETSVDTKDATGDKVTMTVGDDGSVSSSAKDSLLKLETKLPDGGTLTTETALTYTLTANADGTVTYAFEQSHSLKGEGEAGPVSGEAEAVGTTTLEVTLPESATVADALAVNPLDPDTIPPGGSVTSEVTATGSGEVGVSGTKGAWKYLTVGGGLEAEAGHTTVYAKDEDGALSIASGPEEAFSSSIFGRIGTDDWHLRVETGTRDDTTQLEYVEFSADAAGADAYRDVSTGGGMPDRIDDVVTDRYTETRNLQVGESSASVQLGSTHGERSATDFAIERIEREWPDGHQEFVEYSAPRLNHSDTFTEVVGGTGRETSYRVSLQDDGTTFMKNDQSFRDAYGGLEARNDGIDMYYSAAELEQMRAGAEHRTGMTFESNEAYVRYLAGTSAFSPTGGAEEALWTGYNDYNGGTYQLNDPSTGGELPGRQESPGR